MDFKGRALSPPQNPQKSELSFCGFICFYTNLELVMMNRTISKGKK